MQPNETTVAEFNSLNVCVIIPTYNNATTIGSVISGVLLYASNVIVVNDGSTDAVQEVLKLFPSITVESYEKNVGKGWALRKGFELALKKGYAYAITIDSDGQHFASDLPGFIDKLKDNPHSIIIGARNMEQTGVPGKSSFGNKFSNFWFWIETGIHLPDTQSGYRLYPIYLMKEMTFFTKKYEFEIEVLVRSSWKGIAVTSIPVKIFYAEKENRISHFRPFIDFARISVLNTILVFITFLYIKPRDFFRSLKKKYYSKLREHLLNPHESDFVKAISVGFGIFMGIVPIWGFQLVAAIVLAFLFRLNKVLVVIAANISIPPMIPVILFLSYCTGSLWMGNEAVPISFSDDITLKMMKNSFEQYVAGAITLALLAGAIFTAITLALMTVVKKIGSN